MSEGEGLLVWAAQHVTSSRICRDIVWLRLKIDEMNKVLFVLLMCFTGSGSSSWVCPANDRSGLSQTRFLEVEIKCYFLIYGSRTRTFSW